MMSKTGAKQRIRRSRSPYMQLRGAASNVPEKNPSLIPSMRYEGLVPTLTFESDITLPSELMSSGWFQRVAEHSVREATALPSVEAKLDFDPLAHKLDSVLLFEAQREKAQLISRVDSIEKYGSSCQDVRALVDALRRPLEDAGSIRMTCTPLLSTACASFAVAKMGHDISCNQMVRINLQVAYV
jgi:hypothetical protein